MPNEARVMWKILVLAVIPALLLRPMVVCAHNRLLYQNHQTGKESGLNPGKARGNLFLSGHFLKKVAKRVSSKKWFLRLAACRPLKTTHGSTTHGPAVGVVVSPPGFSVLRI